MKNKVFIGLSALSIMFMGGVAWGAMNPAASANVATQPADSKANLSPDFQIEFGPMHKTEYKIFYMGSPPRLVIDFQDNTLKTKFDKTLFAGTPIKNIRTGIHDATLRVAMDLTEAVIFKDHLVADEANPGSMKLVVDIILKSNPHAKAIEQALSSKEPAMVEQQPKLSSPQMLSQPRAQQAQSQQAQPVHQAVQQPQSLPQRQNVPQPSPQQQEMQNLLQQQPQPVVKTNPLATSIKQPIAALPTVPMMQKEPLLLL
jgi:hypothetical protein